MRRIFIFILLLIFYSPLFAQDTRSLVVNMSLDVGSVERSLSLQVSVRNHDIAIIPPFFLILRPITSERTVLVQLPAGQTDVSVLVDEILPDPVIYSVQIQCLDCDDTIPTQFYSPQGNTTSMPDSIFIFPEDLPAQINTNLITRAQISGTIELLVGQSADRELIFELSAVDLLTGLELQSRRVSLMPGMSSVDYVLRGLIRQPFDNTELQVRCIRCAGALRFPQVFPQVLSTQVDLQGINFSFDVNPDFRLNGVLDIILHED